MAQELAKESVGGGPGNADYLRRVSASLRKQLSKPVTRVIPKGSALFANPAFEAPGQAYQNQQQDVEWGFSQPHIPTSQPPRPPPPPPVNSQEQVSAMSPSPPAAVPLYLQSSKQPRYRMDQDQAATQPPRAAGAMHESGPPQWHARPRPDSYQPSDQHAFQQQQQQQGSPSRQGTRSGPYQGYASGTWLEVEMRNDVDDLAHCVDKYASRRHQKRLDEERAIMEGKMAELRRQAAEQAGKITEMELMMPGEDGQYKLLKRELKDMEQDCDFYYQRFLEERQSKLSAHDTIAAALAHLAEIETEFARIKQLVEQPAGVVAAVQAEERAKAEAALAAMKQQQDAVFLSVVPEMVLAAEKVVGRPKRGWPDLRKIFTRLAVVLLLLGSNAASILGTYYLTKTYS